MAEKIVGIIGGTGFYDIPGIRWNDEVTLDTPFGEPSDSYRIGNIQDVQVIFLPRHGRDHSLLPTEINFKANIYGLKSLGAEWLITTSAVGSFREELAPQDMVIIDQFVDRTKAGSRHTFFGNGLIAHIGFAHPVCEELSGYIYHEGSLVTEKIQHGGTYLNMEGPAFSTKAESQLYRSWGMDVIGMTNLAEAKLAREAEICFSTIAIVTDYDAWHEGVEAVSTQAVIENFHKAVGTARELVGNILRKFDLPRNCACQHALENALFTDLQQLDEQTRQRFGTLIEKYL